MDDSVCSANHCLDIGTNIKQCQVSHMFLFMSRVQIFRCVFGKVSGCSSSVWVLMLACNQQLRLVPSVGVIAAVSNHAHTQSVQDVPVVFSAFCQCTVMLIYISGTMSQTIWLGVCCTLILWVAWYWTLGLRVYRVSIFQLCYFKFRHWLSVNHV